MLRRFLVCVVSFGLFGSGLALAQDVAEGEKLFKRLCAVCHVAEKDTTQRKQGPNLWGLLGRKAGTIEGFKYSEAMLAKAAEGIVWDEATLVTYLPDPKAFVPKTKMLFGDAKDTLQKLVGELKDL